MKPVYIYFLLFVLISTNVFAQDVHLSQYYTSNLSLNPAYTGEYDGDIKVTLNSRTQWPQLNTPIKTNMISFEKKFLRFPDEFGLGIILMNDQVSSIFLNTNKAFLSLSYQKAISKHYFRLGVQGGIVSRKLDLNGQTTPDQWDYITGTFRQDIPSGETGLQNSWVYPAFNAGASWRHMFGKTMVSLGYSLFNINRPQDKFMTTNQATPFRHVINATATYYYSPKLTFTPRLLYMNMAGATDFMAGANATRKIKENLGLLFGLGYRGNQVNSDAGIITGGINYGRLAFGLSWDYNISSLSKETKSKSAWEVSLTYITPSKIPNKITVPCDRY